MRIDIKTKLGNICELITKGATPTSLGFSFQENGINFIKVESIDENGNFIKDKFAYITNDCNIVLKRSQLKKDDILFSIAGAIGKVAIVNNEILPANINQALAIIRLKDNITNVRYLSKLLQSNLIKGQYEEEKKGVAQINLSLKNISELMIYLPSISEQQRIANELDKVSELIDKSQTQLQKLDLLIKSKFVEIFGNYNLNCVNNNMQELYKLGNIVGGSTPDTNNLEYWNGTNLWITPAEIGDDDFIINDTCRKLTDKGVKSCSLKLLPKNTVLLSSRAPIGKVAIVGKEMYCNQGFKNIICGAKLNHIYLFYLLKYSNTYLNALGRGATFKEISKSVVENIKINVPDITLQNQFADFVDKVEQSKTKIKASLDKLNTLKKALMQKYFG